MRLFVALNLPKKERDRIYRATKVLRGSGLPVRWIDSENYHITLKFLGNVAEDRVIQVEEALTRVATATGKIDLSVEGFGAFPTIRNPNVVWVGVEPTPSLRCQDLEWALKDCGFDREGRAFHPHLTLGKVDVSSRAGEFRGLDEAAAGLTYKGEMKIRKMDLMRSRVVKGGPTYSLRHRSAFAG